MYNRRRLMWSLGAKPAMRWGKNFGGMCPGVKWIDRQRPYDPLMFIGDLFNTRPRGPCQSKSCHSYLPAHELQIPIHITFLNFINQFVLGFFDLVDSNLWLYSITENYFLGSKNRKMRNNVIVVLISALHQPYDQQIPIFIWILSYI